MQLRWATDETIWLAFFPTAPTFDGLFSSLRHKGNRIPIDHDLRPLATGGHQVSYRLEQGIAKEWEEIARQLGRLRNVVSQQVAARDGTLQPLQQSWFPRWDSRHLTRGHDT